MPARTALVTGGAGGLGRSVVAALVEDGWDVVVPVTTETDLGEHVTTVVADLTDPDDVARTLRTAQDPLKAVVNLVGGFAAGQPVETTPLQDFERMFTLNLRPTYLVTQAALPRLKASGGAIVCTSSATALNPFKGSAGYSASKAAVIAFTQAVAKEAENVRANVILPTMIDTPANRESMPAEQHHKLIPPERIARTVAFLCDDASAAINGAAVPV
ncbi:SDR family NAD(P)-dependent oxidoreductase [Solirubrobacter sp. CPCC 204708]|uniref:SDR family NAD(P)-dependent oxidoreductase n=1 Tax=Solirubrobacter deserti TaxID=2282478 RepID=A0ABT4RU88_9ACTN|nr:SDR family NAD(P)-dependent oxidoreductase [Solirubrobacter deserti]MBE2317258.1 SDR family NAD(P)-dependent oxidoreductase [Solirubrobacter deserti]MDA0142025.1 SDR family NAD(P)-dependent oxidoreductase [Solirubrobacter deserti]